VPRVELQAYVDRYWGWEGEAPTALPTWLPGTGAELLLHYARPFAIDCGEKGVRELGGGQLLCARRAPHRPLALADVGFIAVRFRSGALRHFCALSLAELRDDALAIGDVWGAAGRELAERVALAVNTGARVALIEGWLLRCLACYRQHQPAIEAALRALYYGHRDVRIDALAENLGMSRRHFERVFREQVGLTPKAFQRTARLNHTVRELLLGEPRDMLATALEHGYYDQAHFIHDFRAFVGQSPSTFLRNSADTAHFYNAPIFAPDRVPVPR
jgi:AraC-like DNA-binding protein